MSDLPKPITRKEIYLAAALGVYSGELPTPITRTDRFLYRLATDGVSGSVDEDDLADAVAAYIAANGIADGAFSELQAVPINHRNFYRGEYLGSEVTADQQAMISAGTFDDLYVGDYWTIGGINYRIADINYWLGCGDTAFATQHLVIVPDTILYSAAMNDTNTTTGGYVGSAMYTTNLGTAKTTIAAAFGDLLLTHREYLSNAVTSGYQSAGAWYDSSVELMNEIMVYGAHIRAAMGTGSISPVLTTINKQQLALFRLNPAMVNTGQSYWLRDVVSSAYFAEVVSTGIASRANASYSYGVRPVFAIGC